MTIQELTELVNNDVNKSIKTIEEAAINNDELYHAVATLSAAVTEIVKLCIKLILRLQHSESERFGYDD